jgi:hypothetical protein
MSNFLDAIRLEAAAFFLETENFVLAKEMLAKLGSEASTSSAAIGLRHRIRNKQIAFWQARSEFASVVAARFPNYAPGYLYNDLCCSHEFACSERTNKV